MKSWLAVAIVVFAVGCGEQEDRSETVEQKAARGRENMAAQRQHALVTEISNLPRSAKAGAVTELCDKAPAEALSQEAKKRCASAHLAMARMWFSNGFPDDGQAALNRASAEGALEADVARIRRMLPSALETAKKHDEENRAAAPAILRQALGRRLRQQYLDSDLDINVEVTGKQSDRITLRFALFNAVWANKIRKGELLHQLKDAGFKRLDMTNGYDYHVYWKLE